LSWNLIIGKIKINKNRLLGKEIKEKYHFSKIF